MYPLTVKSLPATVLASKSPEKVTATLSICPSLSLSAVTDDEITIAVKAAVNVAGCVTPLTAPAMVFPLASVATVMVNVIEAPLLKVPVCEIVKVLSELLHALESPVGVLLNVYAAVPVVTGSVKVSTTFAN